MLLFGSFVPDGKCVVEKISVGYVLNGHVGNEKVELYS